MKVKKSLQINIAVLVIAALLIVLIGFLALARVNHAVKESEIANEIVNSAFERNTFRNDYLRTGSERAKIQWLAKSEQFSRLLQSASDMFKDADHKRTIDELIENSESSIKLFSAIVQNREKARAGEVPAELSKETENRLLTQLSMKAYDRVLRTRQLRESAGEHLFFTLKMAAWSIFFVIAVMTAAATINSWTIGRTIINRIQLLRNGASVIGEGNLDHRIEIKGKDEFNDLSTAFNAMTAKLQVSYQELKNEVAERTRAEESMRISDRRYSALFNNKTIGIAHCRTIIDEHDKPIDYEILQVNEAYELITGIARQNIEGKLARDVFPGIENFSFDYIGNYGRIALEGGELSFEDFFETLKQWLSIYVYSPLPGEFIAIFTDISERKRAEEEINELNKELSQNVNELVTSNKELEAFIYSVAHDLRAPLRSISGFSEILLKRYADLVDEKGKKHFHSIIRNAGQMNKIIDDLLHLSRISRHEMHREDVDMSAILQSMTRELQTGQPGRRVSVKIKEGIHVFADPRLMQVALSNLLNNAWKFTARTDDARIEFGALDREGKTVYYMKDNGAGFDQLFTERMFLPFHRLHTEEEFEGTGIGLAIVERAIRRHGGRIWAEGKKNEGAIFFFTVS